jgi:hypothetical protein
MDLRGAKSNVMSLFGIYRNRNCPFLALVAEHNSVQVRRASEPELSRQPRRRTGSANRREPSRARHASSEPGSWDEAARPSLLSAESAT